VLGIDYLSIAFPIERPSMEVFDQERHDVIRNGYVRRFAQVRYEVNGVEVTVWIKQMTIGWWVFLHCNPARHHRNPTPWRGLPIPDLPSVTGEIWSDLHHHVSPRVTLEKAELRRLDAARDFFVTAAERASLLTGLSKAPVLYATRRSLHTDRKGDPQTLYASTKREGCVRAYDHHAHHGTSPPGTLRVEVQAHRHWADRYGGIETVGDISPSAITDLYLNRFSWAAMDIAVVFDQARTERLWSLAQQPASGITPIQATRLLGVERLRGAGIEVPEGHSTASARRAVTAALGLPHASVGAPAYLRLDPAHDEPIRSLS
jgi:hypothetical protein